VKDSYFSRALVSELKKEARKKYPRKRPLLQQPVLKIGWGKRGGNRVGRFYLQQGGKGKKKKGNQLMRHKPGERYGATGGEVGNRDYRKVGKKNGEENLSHAKKGRAVTQKVDSLGWKKNSRKSRKGKNRSRTPTSTRGYSLGISLKEAGTEREAVARERTMKGGKGNKKKKAKPARLRRLHRTNRLERTQREHCSEGARWKGETQNRQSRKK